MRKNSIILAGLGASMGEWLLSNRGAFDPFGINRLPTIPKFRHPSRNMRARSKK